MRGETALVDPVGGAQPKERVTRLPYFDVQIVGLGSLRLSLPSLPPSCLMPRGRTGSDGIGRLGPVHGSPDENGGPPRFHKTRVQANVWLGGVSVAAKASAATDARNANHCVPQKRGDPGPPAPRRQFSLRRHIETVSQEVTCALSRSIVNQRRRIAIGE